MPCLAATKYSKNPLFAQHNVDKSIPPIPTKNYISVCLF